MHNLFEKIEINRRDRLLKGELAERGRLAEQAKDAKAAAAIACILEHDRCFQAFAAELEIAYAGEATPFWGPFGPVINLLNWIMENWPAILEMIMQIIDLFTEVKAKYESRYSQLMAAYDTPN